VLQDTPASRWTDPSVVILLDNQPHQPAGPADKRRPALHSLPEYNADDDAGIQRYRRPPTETIFRPIGSGHQPAPELTCPKHKHLATASGRNAFCTNVPVRVFHTLRSLAAQSATKR
jgi:hypothetical protein